MEVYVSVFCGWLYLESETYKAYLGEKTQMVHGRISLTVYLVDILLNSYIFPKMTRDFSLNYLMTAVETAVVILLCLGIDTLIKMFLGNKCISV